MKNFTLNIYKKPTLFLALLLPFIWIACEDFLSPPTPSTQLSSQVVYQDDATATSATLGMYDRIMSNFFSSFNGELTLCAGLSADELSNTTGNAAQQEFFFNSITTNNTQVRQYFWNTSYAYIYQANAILEGLAVSTTVSQGVSRQLQGEALVMRAFTHFYLANLFGDIPYVNSTDFRVNSVASRETVSRVYDAIINDLTSAQSLLTQDYVSSGRVRPNRNVASALLARVYLYNKNWVKAEEEASKAIGSTSYVLLSDLNNVFLADSEEAIWQWIPVSTTSNTAEGTRFAYTSGIPAYAEMTTSLVNSFEPGDLRMAAWVSQYDLSGHLYSNPYKYKIRNAPTITEYYTVLRLAEQYLIRAEARAMQGKLSEAISDLDAIRSRAGVPLIQTTNPGISAADLLLAIEHERKIELFCEWGHRWFDLKRTGRVDAVMQAAKGTQWKPTASLFPIPQPEILINKNLTQNPGY